jgi:hypothetical protein
MRTQKKTSMEIRKVAVIGPTNVGIEVVSQLVWQNISPGAITVLSETLGWDRKC